MQPETRKPERNDDPGAVLTVLIGAVLAAAAGIHAVRQVPLDAIPDLSDTQVIVYTEYPARHRR